MRALIFGAAMLVLATACYSGQRGTSGYVPQVNLGDRDMRDHRYTSAASHYKTAIMWDASGVQAHVGLGFVFLKVGKKERAIEQFQEALHLQPHSAAAERGIHEARSDGEEELAFEQLEDEVQRDPNNADLLTTYAEELVERRLYQMAEDEAKKALKIDPQQWHAYCALGRIALAFGRTDEARMKLQIAIQHDDTDDDAIEALGRLDLSSRNAVAAVKLFKALVRIIPEDPESHRKLADALDSSGDKSEAAKERALADKLAAALKVTQK